MQLSGIKVENQMLWSKSNQGGMEASRESIFFFLKYKDTQNFCTWHIYFHELGALHKQQLILSHHDTLYIYMYTYVPNHTHICVPYSGSDVPTLISWGEKFILLEKLETIIQMKPLQTESQSRMRERIALRDHQWEICMDYSYPNVFSLQLHPFLRKIQFTNTAGDQICFEECKNHMEKYDIQSIRRNANHFSFLVKVGEFVSKSLQDQRLFINEVLIKWPSNFNQVWQNFSH